MVAYKNVEPVIFIGINGVYNEFGVPISNIKKEQLLNNSDDYEKQSYKVFNKGEHIIHRKYNSVNIGYLDNYEIINTNKISNNKVRVTYSNTVPVIAMGVYGKYDIPGIALTKEKQKSLSKSKFDK